MAANAQQELEYVKTLLEQLSRKGYILKSELLQICRSCRHQPMELGQLEELMAQTVPRECQYVDDTGAANTAWLCTQLDEALEKQGCEDLFSYLQLDVDAPEEELRAALAQPREPVCDQRAKALLRSVDRDTYRLYNRTRLIAEELALRQRFGIYTLQASEYADYLRQIVLLTFAGNERARGVLDGYLALYALICLPEQKKKEEAQERLLPGHTVSATRKGPGKR